MEPITFAEYTLLRTQGIRPEIHFVRTDGGRAAAGFKGTTGDCAVRSIALASGQPYSEVYGAIYEMARVHSASCRKRKYNPTPRRGVATVVTRRYMASLGWTWTPTMGIGTGCGVHLRKDELPSGNLVVHVSAHLTAVQDGVILDAYDPSRGGTRCVYGYFRQES
mgnify:CR=1 FL=1